MLIVILLIPILIISCIILIWFFGRKVDASSFQFSDDNDSLSHWSSTHEVPAYPTNEYLAKGVTGNFDND